MAEQQSDNNNLISCRVCGVIMVKIAKDICPKCFQKEEELFAKIKNFLRANPGLIWHRWLNIAAVQKMPFMLL